MKIPFYLKLANVVHDGWCQQEAYGIRFDREAAEKLLPIVDDRMEELEQSVEQRLPKTELNKGEQKAVTPPARQFNKSTGKPSVYAERFFDDLVETYDGSWFGVKDGKKYPLPVPVKPLYTEGPMRLKHQQNLKQWLMDEYGWKPTFWNYKKVKDEHGKLRPVRVKGQLVKNSPKFHENGKLCPNLEVLGEMQGIVKEIIEWLSLKNRRAVIKTKDPKKNTGWLNNCRLDADGRLSPRHSGLTNTKRAKHTEVANVPRPSSTLGKEMRGLFIASPGKVLVGYDASSLEARVKGHYTAKYDGGQYAEKILADGYDEHESNAILWFWDKAKRRDAKTPGYALQYFCGLPTFARAIGMSQEEAAPKYEAYWEENWALKEFDEAVAQYWRDHGERYVVLIDGSRVYTRSRHSVTNAVMQGTGAKVMDLSYVFMRKWVAKLRERGYDINRVVYYHDEYMYECDPEIAQKVGELGCKSIVQAGKYFKMRVPLAAEYKIGNSWAEVH